MLPSLELKPSGYVVFKNETDTQTSRNCFSLYVQLDDEVQDKQHIVSIKSESRTEQVNLPTFLDLVWGSTVLKILFWNQENIAQLVVSVYAWEFLILISDFGDYFLWFEHGVLYY